MLPFTVESRAGLNFGETGAMLVLSRKKEESIVIDGNIVITVVEVRGDKVRLGIQAPREIPIHRSEVHEAIKNDQTAKDAASKPCVAELSLRKNLADLPRMACDGQ
jgi:carbon storage regulator